MFGCLLRAIVLLSVFAFHVEMTAAAMPHISGLKVSPKMVAHRGAGDLTMPEASALAYSNAVATASDIVKLDVQFTKDGVAVMGHDVTLKRNMGWDVNIADVTYDEILEKGRFLEDGIPGDQRIVRLDRALSIVKSIPEFWIDFKDRKRFCAEQAERVLGAFRAADIDLSRVMLATFNTEAIWYFQSHYPQVRRVLHCSFNVDVDKRQELQAILGLCDKYGLFGLNLPVGKFQTHPDDIAMLKRHGLWISLWYVQDAETALHYRAADVDAFVTDHISIVRKALDTEGS